mmetsp:Transcript_33917/g.61818  ORF Transcript_33917/g.61818 Transcript_33917/m.61818 type:complete len:233 (-) Transcript_33917:115-813(-)
MWTCFPATLLIFSSFGLANAAATKKKLPKVSSKGMMKWKKWWWNDLEGMRQCDDPYGCNDMDDPAEKVAAIKNRWRVEDDDELLSYMRRVRAHASSYTWREQGRTYSFCTKYQGDLQEVLDHLELKHERVLRAARRAHKAKAATESTATEAPPGKPEATSSDANSKPESSTNGGANFHESRDKLEGTDAWQHAKEASMECSSWFVLAASTLWSYATGWLRIGGNPGGVQKEL